jgi:hypothetical protein
MTRLLLTLLAIAALAACDAKPKEPEADRLKVGAATGGTTTTPDDGKDSLTLPGVSAPQPRKPIDGVGGLASEGGVSQFPRDLKNVKEGWIASTAANGHDEWSITGDLNAARIVLSEELRATAKAHLESCHPNQARDGTEEYAHVYTGEKHRPGQLKDLADGGSDGYPRWGRDGTREQQAKEMRIEADALEKEAKRERTCRATYLALHAAAEEK